MKSIPLIRKSTPKTASVIMAGFKEEFTISQVISFALIKLNPSQTVASTPLMHTPEYLSLIKTADKERTPHPSRNNFV